METILIYYTSTPIYIYNYIGIYYHVSLYPVFKTRLIFEKQTKIEILRVFI